jgi:hypothetical protein
MAYATRLHFYAYGSGARLRDVALDEFQGAIGSGHLHCTHFCHKIPQLRAIKRPDDIVTSGAMSALSSPHRNGYTASPPPMATAEFNSQRERPSSDESRQQSGAL